MHDALKQLMAWVGLLPEVGTPVLKAVERIGERLDGAADLERRAAAARAGARAEWKAVEAGLKEIWTAEEIQSAQRRHFGGGAGECEGRRFKRA